jgi:hypothetical protein
MSDLPETLEGIYCCCSSNIPIYRVIQSSSTTLMRLLGRSFGAENLNKLSTDSSQILSDIALTSMLLFVILIIWTEFCGNSSWKYRWSMVNRLKTVVAVASLTGPYHTIRKVLKQRYSKVMIRECYKRQNYFLLFQIKNSVDILC